MNARQEMIGNARILADMLADAITELQQAQIKLPLDLRDLRTTMMLNTLRQRNSERAARGQLVLVGKGD